MLSAAYQILQEEQQKKRQVQARKLPANALGWDGFREDTFEKGVESTIGYFDDRSRFPVTEKAQRFENKGSVAFSEKGSIFFNQKTESVAFSSQNEIVFNERPISHNQPEHPEVVYKARTEPALSTVSEGLTTVLGGTTSVLEKTQKAVTELSKETGSALFDLVRENILLTATPSQGGSKEHGTAEEEAAKVKKLADFQEAESHKARILNAEQTAQSLKQNQVQKTMARLGVNIQELVTKGISNLNFEGALTIANVTFATLARKWEETKAKFKQSAPVAKGKGVDLTMHSGAQEGQSSVSSAGAVRGAG